MNDTNQQVSFPKEFHIRLDFYWQSLAVYAVTLLAYVLIKALWDSTLQQGLVNVVLTDPVVVLLGAFVIFSALTLLGNSLSRRSIIINEDSITYRSRFHERTFHISEIEKISVGRERRFNVRGALAIIRIHIRDRRRPLRIRTGLFKNDHQLVSSLLHLRNHLTRR